VSNFIKLPVLHLDGSSDAFDSERAHCWIDPRTVVAVVPAPAAYIEYLGKAFSDVQLNTGCSVKVACHAEEVIAALEDAAANWDRGAK